MPDGKRHCAIVLTTDLQLSGCFRSFGALIAQKTVVVVAAVLLTYYYLLTYLLRLRPPRVVVKVELVNHIHHTERRRYAGAGG